MIAMAKRKKTPAPPATLGASEPTPEKQQQYPLRFDDPRLREAVETLSRRSRQSINSAILTLIEDGLRARGLWPPPETPPPTR